MLVQDVMQTKLYSVTPETTLPEALRLTGQRGVRHLPVLDGERYTLALATAGANGFNVERLIRTNQSAARADDTAWYEGRRTPLVLHEQTEEERSIPLTFQLAIRFECGWQPVN